MDCETPARRATSTLVTRGGALISAILGRGRPRRGSGGHRRARSGLLRPRDAEALLSEEAFEHDEFLPYWAELWPSALALARFVGAPRAEGRADARARLRARAAEPRRRRGRRAGDRHRLGAGLDHDDRAQRRAQRPRASRRCACSWTEPEPLVERAPWDLVLASDVLYEPRNGEALLPLLPRLIDERGEIWLADPGRAAAGAVPRSGRRGVHDRDAARPPRSPREPSRSFEGCRNMSTQREKAEELRRLHAAPEPLVLVNAWDAASARVVAAAPGCRAIATASWSIAAARGYPDGEAIPLDAMLDAVAHRRQRGRAAGHRRPRARLRRRRRDGRPRDRGGRRRLQPRGLRRRRRPVAGRGARRGRRRRPRRRRGGRRPARDQRPHRRLPARRREMDEARRAGPRVPRRRCRLRVRPRRQRRRHARAARDPRSAARSASSAAPAARRWPSSPRIGIARVSYGPGPMGVAMAALRAPPRPCSRAANRPRSSRSAEPKVDP